MSAEKPPEGRAKSFDPSKHLSRIKGKEYLEVKWRLVWMREEHPDWGIETKLIEHEPGKYALFQGVVTREGRPLGMGHKLVTRQEFADYLGKAETGAVGRALAACGYGTQFAGDYDEGGPVDSPIDAPFPPVAQAKDAPSPAPRSAGARTPSAGTEALATAEQREELNRLLSVVYPDSEERRAYFFGHAGKKPIAHVTASEFWEMCYELKSLASPSLAEQPLPETQGAPVS